MMQVFKDITVSSQYSAIIASNIEWANLIGTIFQEQQCPLPRLISFPNKPIQNFEIAILLYVVERFSICVSRDMEYINPHGCAISLLCLENKCWFRIKSKGPVSMLIGIKIFEHYPQDDWFLVWKLSELLLLPLLLIQFNWIKRA